MAHNALARFMARTDPGNDGCWWWTGKPGTHGYGLFGGDGYNGTAPVWSYRHFNGPIPEGQIVRHTCDNRLCVNPEHLILGTRKDNAQDAVVRGRVARGERSGLAVLTDEVVRQIRESVGSSRAVAQRFGVSKSTINRVRCGSHWSHV
jgi:hypothetical protein